MLGFQLEVQALSLRNLCSSALLTGGLAAVLKLAGAFQVADLALWDVWLRSQPQDDRPRSVVVVEITEEDIQSVGSWPLPQTQLAAAIAAIDAAQPRAIGLISPASLTANPATGMVTIVPTVAADAADANAKPLLAAFQRLPHLIAGFEESDREYLSPLVPTPQLGTVDVTLDLDGKLRRNLLSLRTNDRLPQSSFALRLSLLFLRHEAIEPHALDPDRGWFQLGRMRLAPLRWSGGGYVNTHHQGYHIPLMYRRPLRDFPRVTLSEVLDSSVNPELFRDRIVIIGTAAPRFSYAFETPLVDTATTEAADDSDPRHTVPDLWIQAQATQHLLDIALDGRGMTITLPDGLEVLVIFLSAGLSTALSAALNQIWKQRRGELSWRTIAATTIGVAIAISLATLGISWSLLSAGIWLPMAAMLGGTYAGIVGVSVLEARWLNQQHQDLALILDTTLQHAESIEGQYVQDRDRDRTESTLKSQQLLDAMPVGVTLFNARGELEYANDRARSLLGAAALAQSLNAKDFTATCKLYDPATGELCADDRLPVTRALRGEVSYVHHLDIRLPEPISPQDAAAYVDIASKSRTEQSSKTSAVTSTASTFATTGDWVTQIPIEGWGQPIYDLKGTIQHAIFVFQDTFSQQSAWNERQRLMADLEAKNQALQDADRLKDEFLKRTTHELRTPLNGIIGSLQLVLDDLCDDRFEERELLDQAHQSALHLFEMVNDILDFSRIKAGHVVLDLRSVDLHACLTQSLYLQLANLRQKKLRLIKKYSEQSITVMADPVRLKQVLINIIGNAVKFTDEGSITVFTAIGIQSQPSEQQPYGVVEIHDTGIGVDPLIQPKLFEAFVMADGSSTRRFGGSGLGLTICRNLLGLMGGTIELTSEGRNSGTVVRLRIPLAADQTGTDCPSTVAPVAEAKSAAD